LSHNFRIGLNLFVQPPATKAGGWRQTVSLMFRAVPTLVIRSCREWRQRVQFHRFAFLDPRPPKPASLGCCSSQIRKVNDLRLAKNVMGGTVIGLQPVVFLACG
jgi:hypothetical protein